MDQKWIQILVILVFYQKITSGDGKEIVQTIKEGDLVDISCTPGGTGSMIIWFRVLDNSGMEFIASFSNNGMLKKATESFSTVFMDSKMAQNILTLKSFNKDRDSGIYSCGSLHKGNELNFGGVTRLVGEKVEVPAEVTRTTVKPSLCASTTACVCNNHKQGTTNPSLFCPPIILGPLAGGCGLLLLLLIITTLYCNKIRTRRCPHHHKRKPRVAPEKQVKTSRYV